MSSLPVLRARPDDMSAAARPLNMLALVGDAFGGAGGIAQYNRDLFSGLLRSGIVGSITVLPRHATASPVTPPGITQRPAPRTKLAFAAVALKLALKRSAYDIVFCGHINFARLAAAVARIAGARLVVQLHGFEAWEAPRGNLRRACDVADLVLSVSRYTRGRFLGWSKLAPDHALVVPNTVSAAYTAGADGGLRDKLGLGGKKVLLTVGRLDPRERYKGQDRVIRLLQPLAATGHDCAYVIVGSGEDESRLKALAQDSQVTARVIFAGNVTYDDLPSYYRMADLFVMPSTGEGFGIAFLEAMASGTPALGFRAGGTPDPMLDGDLGLLCEPDGEALLAAIRDALGEVPVDKTGLANRVHAHFGQEAFAARCRELVQRLAHVD